MENIKILENQKILKFILLTIIGSIILTISAKIKIPFYPVPMTMQTFAVLFFGISFGYKIGLSIVILYLFEGIVGMPVFSNSPEKGVGFIYFTGPTMGYLIGFLFAVFFAGYINLKNNFFEVFLKLSLIVSIIYILGILWLGVIIGWDKPLFKIGVQPFLFAEIFKISILALLSKKLLKFRKLI